ncbi:MAG: DUF748 domain-containing protein [Marinobacter sp.]|uniref:DUF748 domain-containing protein n=1 Tax=Marinobacter sp. TaxID=50741 RepID=UPI0034A09607
MATPGAAKSWHKWLSVWLVVVVLLYALLVGGVLPWWLEREVPDRLQQHMGWTATVEDVRINPFNLSVGITKLAATDASGEPVLSLQELDLNPALLALVRGIVAFDHIILEEPFVRLDLLEDAGINFVRDWQAHNAAGASDENNPEQASSPPEIYFERISLSGGELLLRDMNSPDTKEFPIEPLQLELTNLATYERDGAGEYTLSAAIGDQTINWKGSLSLNPLISSGSLSLTDIEYDIVQHFAGDYLPYELQSGVVTIETDYGMTFYNDLQLVTENGVIYLRDLALAVPGKAEAVVLEQADIAVDEVGFSLHDRLLTVGAVTISDTALNLSRNGDGVINLMVPFSGEEAENESSSEPFQWGVEQIKVSESILRWRDEQPTTPVTLEATNFKFSAGELSDKLAKPVRYELGFSLASGGEVSLRGRASPQPFTLEAAAKADQITLQAFEPYFQQLVPIAIRTGMLSLDGSLNLDDQTDPMTGTFSGTGRVDELDATLQDSDLPLLAWQSLIVEPLEYNLSPARLEIDTVTLNQPVLSLARLPNGSHNIERLMPSGSEGDDIGQPENNAGEEPGFIFRVGEFVLENGEVAYADTTLEPTFSTRLHALDGSLTGLSNITPQRARINLNGRVGEAGTLDLEGAIATLGTDETTNLHLVMEELGLPVLSPYFGRYLGYRVDSGKLGLDLNYEITGPELKASNEVILERLQLGEPVQSEEATDAPVRLGLAMLRDGDGRIELNLPIEGNLNNPNFRLGQVMINTFVNVVVKAATSPFNMLGSIVDLAGMSESELGNVEFNPGSSTMANGEAKKLEVVAKALSERTQLILNIRGAVAPELDGPGLKRDGLFEELGIDPNAGISNRISRLEAVFQQQGKGSLEQLREQSASRGEADGPSEKAWELALVAALTEDQSLPSGALQRLASERGNWLQRQLREKYDIPSEQLFVLDPVMDAPAEAGTDNVRVPFQLDAR